MSAFDVQLDNLKSPVPAPPEPDCPDANVWREIAVALTPSDQALAHLQHASRCDHCGPLLRIAISDMDGNLTKSEAKQIAALESARPEWQQRLASRITGTPVPPAPLPWWKAWASAPRLAFAGLALVAVIGVGSWIALRQARPTTPNDLLATAYSEQRTLELRIPGAVYAPIRVQKGAEGSFLSRPAALLKAEFIIATQISSHPSDPNWLQAKARADLLEGKYDSAVDALRHALQIAPKSPSLLIDLGTAYFQRALMADRQEDFGAAYESLSQALASQPDNSVALFNRAIVAEHQSLLHQALDDWDHYLRVDTGSEWATEARQRADALRAKLKEHDQSHAAPLLTPSQIADRVSDPNLRPQVDQRVEEYLHEAVVSWLPQAYPDNRGTPDPGATQALFFLADLTAQQHGDRWLTDLLAESSVPGFQKAVALLAAAVKASDTGDYDTSFRDATAVAQLFEASKDAPGALYAAFQQTLSAQVLRKSEFCRDRSVSALNESVKYPYWWLQIQLTLEQGVCSDIIGDLGTYDKTAKRAMQQAQQAAYGALGLRALGLLASEKSESGDQNAAWRLIDSGLSNYCSNQFPVARGYNLYIMAADMSETARWPNLQLAALGEALALMNFDGNLLLKARTQSDAARVAVKAEQPQTAQMHYAEAVRLYSSVPQSDAVRAYRLYSQIRGSQLESNLRRFDIAFQHLTSVQDEVRRFSDPFLAQMFYAALGQVQLAQNRYEQAEQALRPALSLAEQNLASLRSEEQRLRWSKEAQPTYMGLVEAVLAQGRTEESLDIFERYLGAAQRTGDQAHSSPPNSFQISARLSSLTRETVLAYGLLPGGLAIWTYDNRGVSAQWVRGRNEKILELTDRLRSLASDPGSDLQAFRRDARALYTSLVAPVEDRLEPGRAIVVESDEWLSGIPFEALLDSNGHYMLERAPIVRSLGSYAREKLRPSIPLSADSSALIVASAAGSSLNGLSPLPDVVAEAETVAHSFRNANLLQGRDATVDALKAGLQAAAIFHFAGHSLAAPGHSGLLLQAGDSQAQRLLDADSFRHLRTRDLQLAVLSACSTAQPEFGDNSGFSSITEALLRAGVPHVIASLWPVDSVVTRIYTEGFYRNLLAGNSVSEATRMTARNMLANPRTAHPYYWSAFAAYGRP